MGGDRHRVHPGRRPQRLTESPPSFVKGAPDCPVWVGGTLSADLRNSEPIHDIDTLTAGSSSIAPRFSPLQHPKPSTEKPTFWMGTSYECYLGGDLLMR